MPGKVEIIDQIVVSTGRTKAAAARWYNAVIAATTSLLHANGNVSLTIPSVQYTACHVKRVILYTQAPHPDPRPSRRATERKKKARKTTTSFGPRPLMRPRKNKEKVGGR
jgi:hypothetical protein